MLLWVVTAAQAADCDRFIAICLESDAPLEARRAALHAANLQDPTVRRDLMGVFVDGPLHEDLVSTLIRAGLVSAALASAVPTRAQAARKLGPKTALDTCWLTEGARTRESEHERA